MPSRVSDFFAAADKKSRSQCKDRNLDRIDAISGVYFTSTLAMLPAAFTM